jgi:TonB family protein
MKTFALLAGLVVITASVRTAYAGVDLARAKELYEAAAYEEALAALNGVTGETTTDRVNVEQYRALCLIALGRLPEAERAITALVAADPGYVPSASVASPRVLAMVADVRKREIPAVARRMMDQGRTAFQRKDVAAALENFEMVLKLVDDPVMAGRPEVDDLRVLARGFVDLAAATPVAALTAKSATERPVPEEVPAPAPPPVKPPMPAIIVPAVVIQQTMPRWEPPAAFATIEYKGTIRIVVGADGKVKSAVVEEPSHPAYDARLIAAASTWLYKPATRNGEPIESERVIPVHLMPPPEN